MNSTRSILLASTVLSGVMIAAPVPHAQAAPVQLEVIAQANTPADEAKRREEKEKKGRPAAPKPPGPPVTHAPMAQSPQPPHPPRGANMEQHQRPQPPKSQPPQQTTRPAGPPMNKPRPAEVPPHEGRRNAVVPPKGAPQPPAPTAHGAPPPRGNPAVTPPARNAVVPPKGNPGMMPPPGQHNAVVTPGNPQSPAAVVHRAPPPKGNPAAVPPPTQAINKSQFIAPKGQAPSAGMNAVRAERHEVHEGNRLIIQEPSRTIVEEGGHTFIRHNEDDRFSVGARNVQVEHHGNETMTVVLRPDGVQIIDYDDDDGRLIRRIRRDRDGREIVLIDNGFAGARADTMFLDLPPPVIHMPRDRYIVDADNADEAAIYGVLVALPVERLAQRYTLDQVRYNEPLRALMPRLDLEVNFDSGSWQLTPDQVDRLSVIAGALNRAIQRDPREVFLIEGYTDAVGSDVDNLSLSDRRAESVAVALSEQFGVPPENLVTQGYGKQYLKVQTGAADRANRRVAIQRITPLVDPQAVGTR